MANYNLTHTWQQVDDATEKVSQIAALPANIDKAAASAAAFQKYAICKKNSVTQSAGNDYWSLNCPAISGYTRVVLDVHTGSPAQINIKNYAFDGDSLRVHTQNISGSSQTFGITAVVAFIPDTDTREIVT